MILSEKPMGIRWVSEGSQWVARGYAQTAYVHPMGFPWVSPWLARG